MGTYAWNILCMPSQAEHQNVVTGISITKNWVEYKVIWKDKSVLNSYSTKWPIYHFFN